MLPANTKSCESPAVISENGPAPVTVVALEKRVTASPQPLFCATAVNTRFGLA